MPIYPKPLPLGVRLELFHVTRRLRSFVDSACRCDECMNTYAVHVFVLLRRQKPTTLLWEYRQYVKTCPHEAEIASVRLTFAYLNSIIERLEEKYYEPGGVFVTRDACWNSQLVEADE